MIDPELNLLYKNIQQAIKTEDLFGVPENISLDDKKKLKFSVHHSIQLTNI